MARAASVTNDSIRSRYEGDRGESYRSRARKAIYSEELLERIINQIPEGGKFLDAGCGVGSFLRQLIDTAKEKGRKDIDFHAMDYVTIMAEEAEMLCPEAKIYCDDLKEPKSALTEEKFDYVLCQNVLFFFNPELGERDLALKNLSKLTKREGILDIRIREARFDKEGKDDRGFFDVTENDLRELMRNHGFKIESSRTGDKKSYGPATQGNLDRFYNGLSIVGKNIGEIPRPTLADSVSATRAERLKNAEKGRGGSGFVLG